MSALVCRWRSCTISLSCSTMLLQHTSLGIKSSLNRHLNSFTSNWKLLEQMLHPGLKNSNERRGPNVNLKSLIRIKGWGWRTVIVILAQRALIFFFFSLLWQCKTEFVGKMGNFKVTKHNFYHFKYRALVLYVKAGDYFCSWDGGRGREGKKKTIWICTDKLCLWFLVILVASQNISKWRFTWFVPTSGIL